MRSTNSHRLLNVSLAILMFVVAGGAYVVIRRNGDSGSTGDVVTTTVTRGTVRARVCIRNRRSTAGPRAELHDRGHDIEP